MLPFKNSINELKNENTADTAGLASKIDLLINEYQTAVSSARDAKGPASFIDIVASHNNLQSTIIAPPDVAGLNKTLDSLLAANQALAQSNNGGAVPEISDLLSRANQANTLFKSSQ